MSGIKFNDKQLPRAFFPGLNVRRQIFNKKVLGRQD